MNDDVAIKVTNVSKSFKLPHDKQNSIKGGLISLVKNGKRTYEKQEVLKEISFEIKKGEFFGIVGRNGSGKSTLLKMLAGIYTPTSGNIQVNGSLTPFIELGVGFNPELTGRENVYLNGALLGFNRQQMEAMYDDIVAFAELERFMDQKLKNYSSGMQVRLAFSIAIRARSDILLLDEVLAVGDESFQRKCFDYFETLKRNKKTVVLVTHDMAAVERFCSRAMFVEDGEIKLIGAPHHVASAYSRSNDATYDIEKVAEENQEIVYKKSKIEISLRDENGKACTKFTSGSEMTASIRWQYDQVKSVGLAIFRNDGQYIFGTNTFEDNYDFGDSKSINYVVKIPLQQGKYFVKAGLFTAKNLSQIDFEEKGSEFIVNRDKELARWGGTVRLAHRWVKHKHEEKSQ